MHSIFTCLTVSVKIILAGKLTNVYYFFMEHTELSSMGGKARAKKLTKKRRREIAQMGGKAGGRGRKRKPAKRKAAA